MAEKEYIERGAALDVITYNPIEKSTEPDIIELTLLTAQRQIRKVPAADVVEVRHGEWKKVYDKAPQYVCTNCNHLFNNKGYKYCPNCGAKMDGGAK